MEDHRRFYRMVVILSTQLLIILEYPFHLAIARFRLLRIIFAILNTSYVVSCSFASWNYPLAGSQFKSFTLIGHRVGILYVGNFQNFLGPVESGSLFKVNFPFHSNTITHFQCGNEFVVVDCVIIQMIPTF